MDDFTQRRKRKGGKPSKRRVWVWDKNPRISICERTNKSGGIGYRVILPKGVTGDTVIHLQSKDFEEAKAIARSRGADFRQSRSTALLLGDTEKVQASRALTLLQEAGLSSLALDALAQQYLEGVRHLGPLGLSLSSGAELLAGLSRTANAVGKPLPELVAYAAERLQPRGGLKTVEAVALEMIAIKKGWLERGDLRPASFRDFDARAGRIAKDLGAFLLPELTKDTIYAWLSGLKLAPRTLKNYRMVLSELLKYATQKKYLVENPAEELTRQDLKEIEGGAVYASQPAILTPAEAERLLVAAFEHPELDLGAAVVLGLFGGIRTEEIKRLKWDAVRVGEQNPFVVIGPEIAKKRRIRNVPLPEIALAWLAKWENRIGSVARSSHENDFQKRFKRLAKIAEIAWESNAMRHSFGSYHFALHGNSVETARILGHKQDDSVLFAHYRALASKEAGAAYFSIAPKSEGAIVAFPAQG